MYRLKKHIEHFFYKRFCSIRILFVTSNSLIVIFLTLSIRRQMPLSWRFTDWLFRKLLLKRKCCHFCLFRIQSLVSNVITPWIIRINQTFFPFFTNSISEIFIRTKGFPCLFSRINRDYIHFKRLKHFVSRLAIPCAELFICVVTALIDDDRSRIKK